MQSNDVTTVMPTHDLVVETRGLRKVYRDHGRKVVALDSLDLAIETGSVHGLLGPNGSGKTTTIRMLLGLTRPDTGTVRIFGDEFPGAVPRVLPRVGAVLERGQFAPDLSGRRNLQLLARAGGIPSARVDEVLASVGFGSEARRRYRGYSLGMRRRLALASALLKQPRLVILDEPSNGLDPAGITEMHETISQLAASGIDILLSSHQVAEVQQLCTSVSILSEGSLLANGRVSDLIGESASRTKVGVAEPDRAASVLLGHGHQVRREGDFLIVNGHEHPEVITRQLAAANLFVQEMTAIRPTLESFFSELTGHRPPSSATDREEQE